MPDDRLNMQALRRYEQNRTYKYEYVLRAYIWIGAVVSLVSLGYFLLSYLNIEVTGSQLISLIASATGLILAIASWALINLLNARQKMRLAEEVEYLSRYSLVEEWAHFEELAQRLIPVGGGGFTPVRKLIEELVEQKFIDADDRLFLLEALRARNSVVHHRAAQSDDLVRVLSSRLSEINRRLLSSMPMNGEAEPPETI